MAFNPTREQAQAISAKGNILVSAAAGSGKTAVLTERVISKLCSEDEGVSADRLLIVTFTNAAAAEMRGRIEKRLDEECRKRPWDSALLLQKHRLSGAKICTIDSFCIDLVRENFEKLGISPDFKMSDAGSLAAVDRQVLSKTVNRLLEEENECFIRLLDIIGSEYDESNFEDFVLSLYNYSRQLPFPDKWFDSLSQPYGRAFDGDCVWWQYAFSKARRVTNGCIEALRNAKELLTVNERAAEKYYPAFSEAEQRLSALEEAASSNVWDDFYFALSEFSLSSLPIMRGVSDIFELSVAKDIYKGTVSKALDGLKKIFYADSEHIAAQLEDLYEPLVLLTDILKEFETNLFEEYRRLNTFTFHNTEHLALKLLCNTDFEDSISGDNGAALADNYVEVMVDEYQDTNDLQDMLFYVLSAEEKRLFAVGDVKQSIYGFRGANPKNFLDKKNRYIPIDEADSSLPQKIILGNNFRCKPEACGFINFFFSLFMTEHTGKIIYNEEEMLIPAAKYPDVQDRAVQLHIVDCKGSEEASAVLEGRHIAECIKKIMSEGAVIRKSDNELRPAELSDFTILLRSVRGKAEIIAGELKRQGIPSSFCNEEFCEKTEISTFLSLLAVIDNPQSDIELLNVMMSPLFRFSADDVAELRIQKRDGSLYSAAVFAAENGNKRAKELLDTLGKYRMYEMSNTLPGLVSTLLSETGYADTVSAMPDGAQRRSNLMLLRVYAEQYSQNGSASLGGFVRHIIKLSASGLKAATAPTGGNTVKIMSIHASKGLQFPVCIIAGAASDFNDSEARDTAVYSTEWGIGFKYFDEALKTQQTTVSREVILDIIRAERLEEELRLLYVAMTRTQDRLLITASASDAEKKAEKLKILLASYGCEINSELFGRMKSYLDWLYAAVLLHPDGKALRGVGHSLTVRETESRIGVEVINGCDIPKVCTADEAPAVANDGQIKSLTEILAYRYPYEMLGTLEAKASVSRLANSAEAEKYAFCERPSFMSGAAAVGAERGTAMHKVMQFFDFERHGDVKGELERLYEWQFISEREYASVRPRDFEAFFESDVFKRILKADTVKREMRFLTELPAKKLKPELDESLENEKIIVQGAVDLCFVENGAAVILDFKSDRVDSSDALSEAYGEQLKIYAEACERIFGMPVKEKIIYSFALSREISLE